MSWSRKAVTKIDAYKSQFRSLAIMGVRQCGKTTICKELFKDLNYLNFENLTTAQYATEDPKQFLNQNQNGAVFDEIQRVPHLFNYLQELLDNQTERGKFVLTGSSIFLLNQNINQSLAGRIGFIEMYPFSYSEIVGAASFSVWEHIQKGSYPEVWVNHLNPSYFYPNYIQSVIERDIRQLVNLKNLNLFQQFVKYLVSLVGQELNFTKISNELNVDVKTVQAWIGYLQVAGFIYLLPPYYANFGKRAVKRSKLYFIDCGIVCALLGIDTVTQLENHPLKGNLFENFCVTNIVKENSFNTSKSNLYYWRSSNGVEVDLIIEKGMSLLLVEIKSGSTFNSKWFKNTEAWNNYAKKNYTTAIIYSGDEELIFSNNKNGIPYSKMETLFNLI